VPAWTTWDADSNEAFEESITAQGDKLVAQLFGDKSTATGGSDPKHSTSSIGSNSDSDSDNNDDDNSKHNPKAGGARRSTIPRVCHIILVASVALFGLA
jgi:chitosanase